MIRKILLSAILSFNTSFAWLAVTISQDCSADTKVWNSPSSTDMLDTGNWNPTGYITASDLVYDTSTGTNTNSTAGANFKCNSVKLTRKYKGNWSISGYVDTMAAGFIDSGIGTNNYGNGLIFGGGSTIRIAPTNTPTVGSCQLRFLGSNMSYFDNKGLTFRSIYIDGSVTSQGTATSVFSNTGALTVKPFEMADSSRLTLNRAMSVSQYGDGQFFYFGIDDTINGTAGLTGFVGASDKKDTVPKFKYTGSAAIALNIRDLSASRTGWVVSVVDTLNTGSSGVSFTVINTNCTGAYNYSGPIFTCGTYTHGVGTNGVSCVYRYEDCVFNLVNYDGWSQDNDKIIIDSLQSATFNVSGYWREGQYHTVVRGTSQINKIGSSNNISTFSGKKIYNLTINKDAGVIDSLGDGATYIDTFNVLSIISGKFKQKKTRIYADSIFYSPSTVTDTAFFDTTITCRALNFGATSRPNFASGSSIIIADGGSISVKGINLPSVTTLGDATIFDSCTVESFIHNNGTLSLGTATLKVIGNLLFGSSAIITSGTSDIYLIGTSGNDTCTNLTAYDFQKTGASTTLMTGTVTINGDATISAGTVLDSSIITMAGDLDYTGLTDHIPYAGQSVYFNGSGSQNVTSNTKKIGTKVLIGASSTTNFLDAMKCDTLRDTGTVTFAGAGNDSITTYFNITGTANISTDTLVVKNVYEPDAGNIITDAASLFKVLSGGKITGFNGDTLPKTIFLGGGGL